jgi:intracellular septation protein
VDRYEDNAGGLNLYVAYSFSQPVWVKFKVFGLLGLTFVFVIIQAIWMTKVSNSHESEIEKSEV